MNVVNKKEVEKPWYIRNIQCSTCNRLPC